MMDVALSFFKFLHRFRQPLFFFPSHFQQCYCQKSNNFFFLFPPISAMPLSQTNCNKFFSPSYFGNAIATNSFHKIFSPLFWQCHYHKSIATFFFFFFLRNDMCTLFLQQILNERLLLVVIVELKK